MTFTTFSEYDMKSNRDSHETFNHWEKTHPNAKIISITPVQKTYVEIEYLIGYEEPDQEKNL
ncbi:hypothetical protein KBC79_01465 [Candidatus Woesebacteria bacterium]|nr:hypothetical protein [Candidatus Woesebacteria bacterium]